MGKINNGIIVINSLEQYLEVRDIIMDLCKQHFEIVSENINTSNKLFMIVNATLVMILLSVTKEDRKIYIEKINEPGNEAVRLALKLAKKYTIVYPIGKEDWEPIQKEIDMVEIRMDEENIEKNGGLIN